MICSEFESALPDWLEGEPSDRVSVEAMATHEASCASCGALARDLRAITVAAATLPPLAPARDLWAGIARRIEAPVHALGGVRGRPAARRAIGGAPRQRWWLAAAAAAALLVTASSAYLAGVRRNESDTPAVATESRAIGSPVQEGDSSSPSGAIAAAGDSGTEDPAQATQRVAQGAERAEPSVGGGRPTARAEVSRRLVAGDPVQPSIERQFDPEIRALRVIVDARREQLDSSTVGIIERNLRIIDAAIAESREALDRDPASGFLNEQLRYALTRKVELLRTAAVLPPRT